MCECSSSRRNLSPEVDLCRYDFSAELGMSKTSILKTQKVKTFCWHFENFVSRSCGQFIPPFG